MWREPGEEEDTSAAELKGRGGFGSRCSVLCSRRADGVPCIDCGLCDEVGVWGLIGGEFMIITVRIASKLLKSPTSFLHLPSLGFRDLELVLSPSL